LNLVFNAFQLLSYQLLDRYRELSNLRILFGAERELFGAKIAAADFA
jgi:hypothetical protein